MTEQLIALACMFFVGCSALTLPPTSWTFTNSTISNNVNAQCAQMCTKAVQGNCMNDCEGFAYYSQEIAVDLNEAK